MINDILKLTKKPELYDRGTAVMWTDLHISKKLLDVHLNPDVDLASRKKETIKSTVAWVLDKTGKDCLSILDLGCGPGLYSHLMAENGHRVTGVDISEKSIEYAVKTADKANLAIDYRHQNYLELEDEKQYDLVMMIYTDFGVLLPSERRSLLSRIHCALKPGGMFIFDVLNDQDLDQKTGGKNWDVSDTGFWREKPYLVLSDSFLYSEHKVVLYQHLVIDTEHRNEVYRFWTHYFSHDDLTQVLTDAGFLNPEFYEDVLPESDIWNGQNVTFSITSKKA